jgi:hypothetical protein
MAVFIESLKNRVQKTENAQVTKYMDRMDRYKMLVTLFYFTSYWYVHYLEIWLLLLWDHPFIRDKVFSTRRPRIQTLFGFQALSAFRVWLSLLADEDFVLERGWNTKTKCRHNKTDKRNPHPIKCLYLKLFLSLAEQTFSDCCRYISNFKCTYIYTLIF